MGHGLDVTHPVHQAMEFMAAQLREKSRGQVELRIYPGEQLGSERDMVEQVQLGALDLVKTSTSPLEGFVPVMGLFSLPYVFRDEAHYWQVLDGPIGQQLLAAGEDKFLKGLCYYDAGSRSFYTKARPIRQPADLRGLKIRVQNSRTAMKMIEALGGAPTPLAWGELYSALDQGVVDGAENNPPSLLISRHYELCKFYDLDEHTRVPDVVLLSTHTWAKLRPDVRAMLLEAAQASSRFQRRLWAEKTEAALTALAQAGVVISRPDKRPFQEAVQGLYANDAGQEVSRLLEQVQAVQ
jgi:tripartite ATP-independent transporter DctP family solute receptor